MKCDGKGNLESAMLLSRDEGFHNPLLVKVSTFQNLSFKSSSTLISRRNPSLLTKREKIAIKTLFLRRIT